MDIKQLFDDDNAVSPVIGVILMVAITVILAAVIASFVLGLGNQAGQSAPTPSLSVSYEEVDPGSTTWGVAEVSHGGGDTLEPDTIYFRGSGYNGTGIEEDTTSTSEELEKYVRDEIGEQIHVSTEGANWNDTEASGSDSQVVAGDENNLYVSADAEIDIVYQTSGGDSSSTIRTWSGPDA